MKGGGFMKGLPSAEPRPSGNRRQRTMSCLSGMLIYQQPVRWLRAGVFEAIVHDPQEILRLAAGRKELPSAAILDSQTLQSTPEFAVLMLRSVSRWYIKVQNTL